MAETTMAWFTDSEVITWGRLPERSEHHPLFACHPFSDRVHVAGFKCSMVGLLIALPATRGSLLVFYDWLHGLGNRWHLVGI